MINIVVSIVATFFTLCAKDLYEIFNSVVHPFFSPLRNVPGPEPDGVFGSLYALMHPEPHVLHEEWVEKYGHVMVFKAILNIDRLFLLDPRAVAHVLRHSHDYPKPDAFRRALSEMLGDGLLAVEGEKHRRERRIANPAFGMAQVREFMAIFLDKSLQLRDTWRQELRSPGTTRNFRSPRSGLIDATKWLDRLTLDIIGLAGFAYNFDAMSTAGHPNELNRAVLAMMSTSSPSFLDLLHTILPVTRFISSKQERRVRKAHKVLERVANEILANVKTATNSRADVSDETAQETSAQGRDLLSLLVRANMAGDLPESNRMTDYEVVSQIATFLFAGQNTTAVAVAWALYSIAANPAIQDRLRAEICACDEGERPTMETLNGLPYLDAVVHETLRLYPPISVTVRSVMKNDVIPTEREWMDKQGVARSGIPVIKGDSIVIPILAINRSKRTWGEDAYEFKPERWASLPAVASAIPGVWGNGLSFLGGGRACIGYRFAVIEIKTIVYTLVRAFRFGLAVDVADVQVHVRGMTRPYVRGETEKGPQLPLWVSAIADRGGAPATAA